jgi:hypothetical protein
MMKRLMTYAEKKRQQQQMREAVAAYKGPVTRCPPGRACGKPVKARDDAEQFIKQRNAPLLKRISESRT